MQIGTSAVRDPEPVVLCSILQEFQKSGFAYASNLLVTLVRLVKILRTSINSTTIQQPLALINRFLLNLRGLALTHRDSDSQSALTTTTMPMSSLRFCDPDSVLDNIERTSPIGEIALDTNTGYVTVEDRGICKSGLVSKHSLDSREKKARDTHGSPETIEMVGTSLLMRTEAQDAQTLIGSNRRNFSRLGYSGGQSCAFKGS